LALPAKPCVRSNEPLCSGGCVVAIRGDTMLQVEGLLGLSYGF
jgi:hypothetical protein